MASNFSSVWFSDIPRSAHLFRMFSAPENSRLNPAVRLSIAQTVPRTWTLPLVGCVISGRNHTFDILTATKECVINIPTVELAKQVVGCGNTSGKRVDKFQTFGLTPVAASQVKAPLIKECYANLECRVVDTRLVAAYNFFVLEVVKAWIARSRRRPRTMHHGGKGVFMVASEMIRLPSKKK